MMVLHHKSMYFKMRAKMKQKNSKINGTYLGALQTRKIEMKSSKINGNNVDCTAKTYTYEEY